MYPTYPQPGQQQGGPMGLPVAPQMQQPLGGQQAQDPRSQYLMAALQQMRGQPQGNAMGLDANLLASALDQYALKQRKQQLDGQPGGALDPGASGLPSAAYINAADPLNAAGTAQAGQGGLLSGLTHLFGGG